MIVKRETKKRSLWVRALRAVAIAALVVVLGLVVSAMVIGRPPVNQASQTRIPPPAIDTAPGSSKPVLVFLHGAGLNVHNWDAVIRHLEPSWRAVAIDLPGHGARRDGVYTLETARAAVAAAAASVAPSPVVLVGDSLGGYTAMASAASVPADQLRGLVVSGCTSNMGTQSRLRYWRDIVIRRNLLALYDERDFAAKALKRFEVADADARSMIDAGMNLRAIEPAVEALLGIDFITMLAQIPKPVLILNGSLDHLEEEPLFLAAARHGSSHHVEGAGHGISLSKPVAYAAQIDAFAARVFAQP